MFTKPKLYTCTECGRIDSPMLYGMKDIKYLGWDKIDRKWVCRNCLRSYHDNVKHYNLVVAYKMGRLGYQVNV